MNRSTLSVEALVRVIDEDVARLDRLEQIVGVVEPRRRDRRPRRVAKVGDVEARNLKQARVVDLAWLRVHVVRFELEAILQHQLDAPVGVLRKLEPNRRLEAPLADLLAHEIADVAILLVVFVELDFGVARQPEEGGRGQAHAGIQLVRVLADHLVQPDEHAVAGRHVGGERHPLRQLGRHLHAGVDGLPGPIVVEHEREREREVGEERERLGRKDHERRERGRDLRVEVLRRLAPLRVVECVPVPQVNSMARKLWHEAIAEALGALTQHGQQSLANVGDELPARGRPVLAQHRHPLHEKLVEVGREDREELDPFEQRRPLIEGLGEHTAVELEPAEVPVEPDRRELGRANGRLGRVLAAGKNLRRLDVWGGAGHAGPSSSTGVSSYSLTMTSTSHPRRVHPAVLPMARAGPA